MKVSSTVEAKHWKANHPKNSVSIHSLGFIHNRQAFTATLCANDSEVDLQLCIFLML